MLPPRQRSQKSAQLGGRASADGERPGPASSAGRKGKTGKSRRRPSRGERAKGEKAGRKRPASDHQATVQPGSPLPESRIAGPPQTPLDFRERQDRWATKDNDSLRRNIWWHWHLTAQHVVIYAGPSVLALAIFALTRELGLPVQTALTLSGGSLASATVGVLSRELLSTLSGKRRSRLYRDEDDVSRNGDDRSP